MRASYDLKVDRAEKHLIDLERAISDYVDSHPYEVRIRREGKKNPKVHRLHFTRHPSDDVALIAADFLYNIRSSLDHVAAALVPANERDSVMFPIFFKGVWNEAVEGENEQRTKQRARWNSVTRNMQAEVVAILKTLQPDDVASNELQMPGLIGLNRLSNTDRHSKLPIFGTALADPTGSCRTRDGDFHAIDPIGGDYGFRDGTKLVVPRGAMDVKIEGTPVVFVRIGTPEGGYRIPDAFRNILLRGTRQAMDMLRPFDRVKRS